MLNCNSINSKIAELKNMISQCMPDFLCLTETWLDNDKYAPRFHNYHSEWQHRTERGGGLGIIIHKDIQYRKLDINSFPNGNLEVQAITIYSNDRNEINLLNLYNPVKDVTTAEIEHYLLQLGNKFIITGDFNAHSPILKTNDTTNTTGKSLEDILLNQDNICLINPIDFYTYLDKRTGTQSCLDLCLTSADISTCTNISQYIDVGSDHRSIKITIDRSPFRTTTINEPKWKLSSKNLKLFNADYITSSIHYPTDIDTAIEDLTTRITSSARNTMTTTIKSFKSRKTPWWNNKCQEAVKNRRNARRNFEKHPTDNNRQEYMMQDGRTKEILKEEKKRALHKYISSLTHDVPQSRVWKKIKAFTSTYRPTNYPITVNNNLILDAQDKANMFCQHYKTQSERLLTDEKPFENYINERQNIENNDDINKPITENEVMVNIRLLKNKTPGIDNIPNLLITCLHPTYLHELINIYNQSFITGYVPHTWKMGIVLPIPKPNKPKEEITSYRPITLLSCLGKLLEKILQKRLEYYIEHKDILQPNQHGFRPAKNTEDILIRLSQQVKETLENRQACGVVYVDIKGAFDTVWRHGLQYKLARTGIRGIMLKWLGNYMEERNMQVNINGHKSNISSIDAGVPQGAVLSPLLFNVMLHDLPQMPHVDTYIFADDITFSSTDSNLQIVQDRLQQYCSTLENWCTDWKLEISEDKTKFQIFTRKRNKDMKLNLANSEIKNIKVQKLLGIQFDAPLLTFKNHIEYLKTDCNRRINIMKSIASHKYGASRKVLQNFYTSYIRSKMRYGSAILCETNSTALRKLNVIQNACLRLSLGARKTTPITSLEAEANIPPLEQYLKFMRTKTTLKILSRTEEDLTKSSVENISSLVAQATNNFLNNIGITKIHLYPSASISSIPPWIEQEQCIYSTTNDIRTEVDLQSYIEEEFRNYNVIYTDGSRTVETETSVAAGIYIPNKSIAISWKLNPAHTVVAAELFAIHKALEYILNDNNNDNYLIFSDSQGALNIIKGKLKTYKNHAEDIKKLLQKVNNNRTVVLHWIKGHSGIKGNELADKTANIGHNNNRSELLPLTVEEVLVEIKGKYLNHLNQLWKSTVQNTQKGQHLLGIRNEVQEIAPIDTKNRRKDTALYRLRLGHVGVNKHLYRFHMSDTSTCEQCNTADETVEHFLIDCDAYEEQRGKLVYKIAKLLGHLPSITVKLLLGGEKYKREDNIKITNYVAEYVEECGRLEGL